MKLATILKAIAIIFGVPLVVAVAVVAGAVLSNR